MPFFDDDFQKHPTFDALEHTRSSFSRMSISTKSIHCPRKGDDDEEIELVVKEIDEKVEKSYEEIQKLIEAGKVDKLKLDQCKIYLKKHGLRMAGKKDALIQRIKEHIVSSTKADDEAVTADDDDDIEVAQEVEFVVPELDEKDKKSYEAIHNLIEAGKVDKLKLDQCKIYLKKHGLRMAGNKSTLIQRIMEHIDILDGGGERKYPASSFVLNCKGDSCTGDLVMFEQNVYEMFNIASRSAMGPPCGTRTVAGRIIKESYGASKQQHTFTIEVLWSKGDKQLPPLHPLLIKGRNLYRIKTIRQKWEDEEERRKILSEKHARGAVARSNREARVMSKAKRPSKHVNDKRGSILQHPPQQERYECKNQLKENHFHVNDKIEPILQPAPHVQSQQGGNENKNHQKVNQFHGNDERGPIMQHPPQVELPQGWQAMKTQQKNNSFHGNEKRRPIMQHPSQVRLQQGWQAMKNQQKNNHFHGNENRGPILQHPPPVKLQHEHNKSNQPKENRFNRSYYAPTNGQRRSNNVYFNHHPSERTQCHYPRRHPFTNINMEHSRMIPHGYGGSRHRANYMDMGECSRTPYGTLHHSTSRMNVDM